MSGSRGRHAVGATWSALLLAATILALLAVPVLGAEPAATGGTGGDPRSPGEGPGLVGDPGFAVAVVVGVAALAVVATLAYVRLTTPRPGTGRR